MYDIEIVITDDSGEEQTIQLSPEGLELIRDLVTEHRQSFVPENRIRKPDYFRRKTIAVEAAEALDKASTTVKTIENDTVESR